MYNTNAKKYVSCTKNVPVLFHLFKNCLSVALEDAVDIVFKTNKVSSCDSCDP